MNAWRTKLLILVAMLALIVIGWIEPPNPFYVAPVQAAPPLAKEAPPEVKECQLINTASISNGVISILRCQPENGTPYLINSFGFMVVEE